MDSHWYVRWQSSEGQQDSKAARKNRNRFNIERGKKEKRRDEGWVEEKGRGVEAVNGESSKEGKDRQGKVRGKLSSDEVEELHGKRAVRLTRMTENCDIDPKT